MIELLCSCDTHRQVTDSKTIEKISELHVSQQNKASLEPLIKWPATYCIDTEAKALAHLSQAISPGGWESLQVSGFN